MDDDQLRLGLDPPEGVQTAWGARWIISPAGDVDPVWDRTDAIGPDHRRRELLDHLAARVGDTPYLKAPRAARARRVVPLRRRPCDPVRGRGRDRDGHPRRSYGYLYVGAWFKADEPPSDPEPA
jgi:hypothetical protein